MTDQKSLDDIAMLLMRYPGVKSAWAFKSGSDGEEVWIRFRCSELASLKDIACCAVAANVLITVGDPESRLCCEAEGIAGLPYDVRIEDANQPKTRPTDAQVFGVYLARNLKQSRLMNGHVADQLLRGWNAIT